MVHRAPHDALLRKRRSDAAWHVPRLSAAAGAILCAVVCLLVSRPAVSQDSGARLKDRWKLPSFLDVFLHRDDPEIVTDNVHWPTAHGTGQGVLARHKPPPAPATATQSPFLSGYDTRRQPPQRYPALLVIPDNRLRRWHRRTAREFAEIGYVALAVDLALPAPDARGPRDPVARERAISELVSAVRWLRRRDDVFPDRVGVIGWSDGGYWASAVAATAGLQACINCNGPLLDDAASLAELRHTAVMRISGGSSVPTDRSALAEYGAALRGAEIEHRFVEFEQTTNGFMFPENADVYRAAQAERAWFEIYEFFGQHVEDAPISALLRARPLTANEPQTPVATIAELMRAVNTPTGVRGLLAESLRDQPDSPKAWKEVRARAKLLAASADLLGRHQPPRGSATSWRNQVAAYRSAALAIAEAADANDYTASRAALTQLTKTCGNCHRSHR